MKKLAVGDAAPTFTVRDVYEQVVSFNSVRPNSTIIAFLRYSTCPFCNLAIHKLTEEFPTLQSRGIDVIAFVQSSQENILKYLYQPETEQPQFPIIHNQSPNVYKMYGVNPTVEEATSFLQTLPGWIDQIRHKGFHMLHTVDGNVFLAPALFMVSPTGNLVLAKYATNVYDHNLFDEIYRHVNQATLS